MKTFYILLVCYMPILDKYLPKTDFGPGIPDIGPVRVLSYLLIAAFFARTAQKGQIKLFPKWITFIFIYIVIVLASVSWSNYSYTIELIQTIFETTLIPIIIAIIGLNLFNERDNIDAYIKNIMLASLILSLMSIYHLLSMGLIDTWNVVSAAKFGKEVRSTAGTLRNPNALAIFLVLTIPCILYAVEKQMIPKKIGWVVSAFVVGGIICTISRKGVATGILAFCLYYFLKGQYKKIVAFGFVVVALTLFLSGFAFISARFNQDTMDHQLTEKWDMAKAGLQMYKKSPLIGLGWKGYYDRFGKYFPHSKKLNYDAHNIFITALTNYGLIGFIPFLGIFLYPLFAAWKALKVNDNKQKDLAIVCISSIIPFMVNGWYAGGLFYLPMHVVLLYTNISIFLSQDT